MASKGKELFLRWMRSVPKRAWDDVFLVTVIVLIALAAFGLGRLSVFYGAYEPLKIEYPDSIKSTQEAASVRRTSPDAGLSTGMFVASVSGSKYHLPECPGARTIKEENKIWFSSKEEAEAAGYTPAANCPGL